MALSTFLVESFLKLDLCKRIPSTFRSCDADLSLGSHMIPSPKNASLGHSFFYPSIHRLKLMLCCVWNGTRATAVRERSPPYVCNAVKSPSASFKLQKPETIQHLLNVWIILLWIPLVSPSVIIQISWQMVFVPAFPVTRQSLVTLLLWISGWKKRTNGKAKVLIRWCCFLKGC